MNDNDVMIFGMQHAERTLETLLAQSNELQKRGRLHNHPTRDEYIDFAYGNTVLSNPNVTKEMVEKAADELFASKPEDFFFRPDTCPTCRCFVFPEDATEERAPMTYTPERPSFKEIYMSLAWNLSKRSTCVRLRVGTVIASTDYRRVLAVGYNGNARGEPNICDRLGDQAVGSCGCLHAESNAIINCSEPRSTSKIVFVTTLPCVMCAKMLVNLGGVELVVWGEDYRIKDSLALLERAGIGQERLAPRDGQISY